MVHIQVYFSTSFRSGQLSWLPRDVCVCVWAWACASVCAWSELNRWQQKIDRESSGSGVFTSQEIKKKMRKICAWLWFFLRLFSIQFSSSSSVCDATQPICAIPFDATSKQMASLGTQENFMCESERRLTLIAYNRLIALLLLLYLYSLFYVNAYIYRSDILISAGKLY